MAVIKAIRESEQKESEDWLTDFPHIRELINKRKDYDDLPMIPSGLKTILQDETPMSLKEAKIILQAFWAMAERLEVSDRGKILFVDILELAMGLIKSEQNEEKKP